MRKTSQLATTVLVSLPLLFGCASDSTSLVGMTREIPLEVGVASLPEVSTSSDTETSFTFKAESDQLLVVFFGYTMCPDICPTSLSDFRAALRRMGSNSDRIDLAFVTVDPERDTAEKLIPFLSTYASRFHAIRTTDFSLLKSVQDKFLVRSSVTTDESGYVRVTHTGTAFVVNSSGQVVSELPFGIGPDGMENDFTVLLNNIENGDK
jgi:cytochrome oxidase Cu insertion factor (SCO1/SenC/PrrC family)